MTPRLPSWFKDTITIIRPGTDTDRYGDEIPSWSTATEHDEPNCKVNPAVGSEDRGPLDERAALTKRRLVAAPPCADILSTDRILWDSEIYEIAGEVLRWRSPLGGVDHLYFELVRVEG